ncbi:MAG: hypothetical protein V7641_269 [Blastocatellia bacterium]
MATPAVAGTSLFIGSCAGVFYALDKSSGAILWQQEVARGDQRVGFHGDPLVTEDMVIVGTDINGVPAGAGYVYAFDRGSGQQRWKAAAGRGIASDLIRAGASLYGVTLSDAIVSLDLQTGRQNWSFTSRLGREDRIPTAPVSAAGYVFYGDRDGGLYALQAETGQVIWKRQFTTPVSTSLVAAGTSLYLGAASHIYRINQKTGEIEADFLADGWSFGRPLVVDQALLIFIGDTLTSLDLSLKQIRWRQKSASQWTSPRPLRRGSLVLAGNESGEVLTYRISDGAAQGTRKLQGIIRSLGNGDHILYVGTKQGTVYALRERNLN